MAQRPPTMTVTTSLGVTTNRGQTVRKISESVSNLAQDEQRQQNYLERQRLLSPKVERCLQELVERVSKFNSAFNFDLLAPASSDLLSYFMNDNKEFYFDFYLVWKNPGKIKIERDRSSICCKIKYVGNPTRWSRAEQARLLISNVDKKKSCYFNGRVMRDIFFETLHTISPDLIRLNFFEHLIYFDLIIPVASDKFTCHITLLPCLHLSQENEVLLPFGTLRWYPRSLICSKENPVLISLQQPLQNFSIRRYMSTNDIIDETSKLTKEDLQVFARVRTIIRELLLACTSEHIDSVEQLQLPFENDDNQNRKGFFISHRLDRNCNIFPAGQYLLNDIKAKQFFRELLRTNIKIAHDDQTNNIETRI
ncbi:unnamed protein product [Rotaria socialis]|uniref:Uncharacterized protein n=1 Tax=Rotaria socialis TaxID=392032 RepID=A0A819TEU3_9BILA|nr:unnamed protein product [Rotaria socialis]CAF3312962.1 unnamed protein product [Rotaria socialis]CAF3550868.1 unnamed protein product [Rotaria socialis]CAF3754733.1 unnamed protein product [Rotaria socialis]CAF4086747.1 unnamed protein product [Rotaria socialis]